MLAFPNAKINLGLRVTEKRTDGYHTIDSCLYPLPWRDVLEIVPSDSFSIEQTGLSIPGNPEDNLCVRAFRLLSDEYHLPPVKIHLHKVVPMGAGLGGGSSDGAYTLKVLNALFQLELSVEKLKKLAAQLGSDCPFFVENKPVIASGTGTTIEPINLSLKGAWVAIKHPGIHISTSEAYAGVTPAKPEYAVKDYILQPIDTWKKQLINDFESSVFENHPSIRALKDELYIQGASYAAMSGSGSAVFGLFEKEPALNGFEVFEL